MKRLRIYNRQVCRLISRWQSKIETSCSSFSVRGRSDYILPSFFIVLTMKIYSTHFLDLIGLRIPTSLTNAYNLQVKYSFNQSRSQDMASSEMPFSSKTKQIIALQDLLLLLHLLKQTHNESHTH